MEAESLWEGFPFETLGFHSYNTKFWQHASGNLVDVGGVTTQAFILISVCTKINGDIA